MSKLTIELGQRKANDNSTLYCVDRSHLQHWKTLNIFFNFAKRNRKLAAVEKIIEKIELSCFMAE